MSSAVAAGRFVAVLVTVLLLSCPLGFKAPVASAAPLVVNGGFEQPVVPQDILTFAAPNSFLGWSVDSGSVDVTGLTVNGGWQAASGQQSLDLSGTSAGSIHQDIATDSGARYVLTFSYAGDPTLSGSLGCSYVNNLKHMAVSWEGTAVSDITVDTTGRTRSSMGWQQASLLVIASDSSSRLAFTSFSEGWCGPTLDDVAVTPLSASQTLTTLTSSSNPSVVSQPVTFTATVAGATSATHPTGNIRFEVDGSQVGAPVALDAHDQASITTGGLSIGARTVHAVFEPTGSSEASGGQLVQTVTKAASVTGVGVKPDPTVAGQDATFTASVAGIPPATAVPSGQVQFTEADGTPIGGPEPLIDGKATMVASAGAGQYAVIARYLGDERFTLSSGKTDQTVNRADTITTLTSTPNPVSVNDKVTFSVTVAAKPPGYVQPDGTVVILIDGEDVSGPIPLFDDGPAQSAVDIEFQAPPTAQASSIRAIYSGDEDTNPSSSPVITQTVTTPAPATQATPAVPAPAAQAPPVAATTTSALTAMNLKFVRTLKRGGFRALTHTNESLTVAGPGTLTQRLYIPSPRAGHSSTTRRLLVAFASHLFTSPGTGTWRLRLTPAGQRAIRNSKSLKVAIDTRFVPRSGAALTATTHLTLSRRGTRAATATGSRTDWQHIRDTTKNP